MIHTILLNSRNLYSGTISDGTYLIDWGLLPEKKYRVIWGFGGGTVNQTGGNNVAMLHVELGQGKIYTADSNVVRGKNTLCIGVLVPNEEGSTQTFMYGDKNINGPIYLSNRPTNNEFSVSIRNLTGGLWTDSVGGTMQEYIINLSFEEQD